VIFLDTGFLFALVSKRDAHHSRVVEVLRTFKDMRLVEHLLTTNPSSPKRSHSLGRSATRTPHGSEINSTARSWHASTGPVPTRNGQPSSTSSGTKIKPTVPSTV
jgi:hypothetical protein